MVHSYSLEKNTLCLGIKGSAMSVQRVKKKKKYADAIRLGSEVWCVKNTSCSHPFKGIGERKSMPLICVGVTRWQKNKIIIF